jgi:hypothetical protein
MEDENIEEVIAKAKNQRRQKLFEQRVALLKAEDAFKQLGGEDNYELSLSAIVTAYPDGITMTRVREMLPDSKELDAAKETLKSKGLIDVGSDKRSPLLKPVKPVSTAKSSAEEPAEPMPTAKKATLKPSKAAEDDTEE